jgi:hypothetical protein
MRFKRLLLVGVALAGCAQNGQSTERAAEPPSDLMKTTDQLGVMPILEIPAQPETEEALSVHAWEVHANNSLNVVFGLNKEGHRVLSIYTEHFAKGVTNGRLTFVGDKTPFTFVNDGATRHFTEEGPRQERFIQVSDLMMADYRASNALDQYEISTETKCVACAGGAVGCVGSAGGCVVAGTASGGMAAAFCAGRTIGTCTGAAIACAACQEAVAKEHANDPPSNEPYYDPLTGVRIGNAIDDSPPAHPAPSTEGGGKVDNKDRTQMPVDGVPQGEEEGEDD